MIIGKLMKEQVFPSLLLYGFKPPKNSNECKKIYFSLFLGIQPTNMTWHTLECCNVGEEGEGMEIYNINWAVVHYITIIIFNHQKL